MSVSYENGNTSECSEHSSYSSSSDGSVDIVYQLINVEKFMVDPEYIYSMLNFCFSKHKVDEVRAVLIANQFEISIQEEPVSDSESLFNFNEVDTDIDTDEEREMDEDIDRQDENEELESRLDNYLMEQIQLTGHGPDEHIVRDIYDKVINENLSTQDAINQFKLLPISDEDKQAIEEFKKDTPVWMSEIHIEQKKTELCLNKYNFKNLVKEIANDYKLNLKFEPEVFEMLQHVSEDYLLKLFDNSQITAILSKREEIRPKDMNAALHYLAKLY